MKTQNLAEQYCEILPNVWANSQDKAAAQLGRANQGYAGLKKDLFAPVGVESARKRQSATSIPSRLRLARHKNLSF